MRRLSIDIETYCSVDLVECGLYRYAQGEDFEVLLLSYAYDDDPVSTIDLAQGEDLPPQLIAAIQDPAVEKRAYNAQFERVCLSSYLGVYLHPSQWHDTMTLTAMAGLPLSLGEAAKALGGTEQKDTAGKLLINYFSKPCKPTRANGQRTRNLPHHDPERWALYVKYNAQDVLTERDLYYQLKDRIVITPNERDVYVLDQLINDKGFKLDIPFIKEVVKWNTTYNQAQIERAKQLTGLENPNSTIQLKEWISSQGAQIDSLTKADVEELLTEDSTPSTVKDLLKIRQELSKSSLKKYDTMLQVACSDDRVHGALRYYGASRTGRWAGRMVQPQNMTKNYRPELEDVKELIKQGHIDLLPLLYESPTDVLSQIVRMAIVAEEGHTFIISDYSAIEARVIAWVAQEQWLIDVFAGDGKVYEATASRMFNAPIANVDKSLRQRGKVATLALGYEGGVNALIAMGALKMGIQEHELQGLVNAWRASNPSIVKLWGRVNTLACKATNRPNVSYTLYDANDPKLPQVKFIHRDDNLYITLPSGRQLCYYKAKLTYTTRGAKVTYKGVSATTKAWGDQSTYGGKLTENIVQAIARDCLAEAMLRLDAAGYQVVMHVHDEVVIEVPKEDADLTTDVEAIMGELPQWAQQAPGLKLPAASFTSDYYKKD